MNWLRTYLQPGYIRKIVGLAVLLPGLVLAAPGRAEPQKRAVIIIGPDVTFYEGLSQHYRIEYERKLYYEFGYAVEIKKATTEEIVAMIIEGKTDRISFLAMVTGLTIPKQPRL